MNTPTACAETRRHPARVRAAPAGEQVPATSPAEAGQRVRCRCGKWWAYRSPGRLTLQCRLCRRQIIVQGDNLTVHYR